MKDIKMTKKSDKKVYKSWRKSVEKDGYSKSVSVDECENGFIITICEDGKKGDDWTYDSKKYISTKNPLENEMEYKEDEDVQKKIMEAINALEY